MPRASSNLARTLMVRSSLLLLALSPVRADTDHLAADRQTFLSAAAALAGTLAVDPAAYEAQRRQLKDYILAPYLDYVRMRRDLYTVDAATANNFLASEATTQLGRQFRGEYLAELARRGDWPAFIAFDKPDVATTSLLRCQRVQALLATDRTADAREEFASLWPTGQELPDGCDDAVNLARSRGWLTGNLVWQRLRLAVDAANSRLASDLVGLLPEDQQVDGARLAGAVADPESSLKAAATWPDGPAYREAVVRALRSRARADVVAATGHWQLLAPRFQFAPGDRATILHDLALYSAVAYRPDAEDWFERVPVEARSEQLADWQLRAALAAENWDSVLKVVEGLPAALADASRPRYWRARALAKEGRDADARAGYAALATEANFHGFLAADQLAVPYAICPKEIVPDPARTAALREQTNVARALELHAVGWRTEAVRAWDYARTSVGEADRLQLALLASGQDWHDRVVSTLNSGDDLRYYSLRFPLAERETVQREASRNELDPAWTFALIRSESAWQPDAHSPANAWGLMQLLPTTGKLMASQLGLSWSGTSMLLDPTTNIQLGTRYLAQQAERFQNSPWLASAAYNAGAAPVQKWLAGRGTLPADVFIETIPYRETREYVTRVLAFSVIYDWRLNGKVRSLTSRLAIPGSRDAAGAPAVAGLRPVVCPGGAS